MKRLIYLCALLAAAVAQAQTPSYLPGRIVLVTQYAACAGNDAVDDSVGFNNAISAVASKGGTVQVPNGADCRIKNPIYLKSHVRLQGMRSGYESIGAPQSGIIRAAANLTAMITQTDLTVNTRDAVIEGLTLDGRNGTYTVTDMIKLAPQNDYIENNVIENGSGNCVNLPVATSNNVGWVNWIKDNQIGCAGYALTAAVTDGRISGNYFSTSSGGSLVKLSGAGSLTFSDNQIEKANGTGAIGLEIATPASWTCAGTNGLPYNIVGNRFTLNYTDVKLTNGSGACTPLEASFAGNEYNSTSHANIVADSNIQGVLVHENFTGGTPTNNIMFGGTGNTGWVISGTSLNPTNTRFVNLPADAQVLVGGNGNSSQLGTLVINTGPIQLNQTTASGQYFTNVPASGWGIVQSYLGAGIAIGAGSGTGSAVLIDSSANMTVPGNLTVQGTINGSGLGGTKGIATLAAGTVTVSSAAACALGSSCHYQLTHCVAGGTLGTLSVGTISAAISFVINSTSNTDTSQVCWSIQ